MFLLGWRGAKYIAFVRCLLISVNIKAIDDVDVDNLKGLIVLIITRKVVHGIPVK